jgi:hypothetical protein
VLFLEWKEEEFEFELPILTHPSLAKLAIPLSKFLERGKAAH